MDGMVSPFGVHFYWTEIFRAYCSAYLALGMRKMFWMSAPWFWLLPFPPHVRLLSLALENEKAPEILFHLACLHVSSLMQHLGVYYYVLRI